MPTKALAAYPRVVRHVQTVINGPVKEEEEDEDGNRVDWQGDSAAVVQPNSTPTAAVLVPVGMGFDPGFTSPFDSCVPVKSISRYCAAVFVIVPVPPSASLIPRKFYPTPRAYGRHIITELPHVDTEREAKLRDFTASEEGKLEQEYEMQREPIPVPLSLDHQTCRSDGVLRR